MNIENISIFSLFLAGFLSILTPSTLLLMPPYLAYLSGSNPLGKSTRFRNLAFILYALMFMGGFALLFIILFGVPIGLLGQGVLTITELLAALGGIFLILFATYIGVRTLLQIFSQEKIAFIFNPTIDKILTIINCGRSAFFGTVFAAVWTPVIGPILGAVLTLAIQGQNVGLSMFYLIVYSIGLAVPFIIFALLLLLVTNYLRRFHQYVGVVELFISVFVLFVTGLMLVTGGYVYFSTFLNRLTSSWLIDKM